MASNCAQMQLSKISFSQAAPAHLEETSRLLEPPREWERQSVLPLMAVPALRSVQESERLEE